MNCIIIMLNTKTHNYFVYKLISDKLSWLIDNSSLPDDFKIMHIEDLN